MDIKEIIAAAPTVRETWVGQLTNGKTEAILTFNFRKAATIIASRLREAGATIVAIKKTEYGEYLLQVQWTA